MDDAPEFSALETENDEVKTKFMNRTLFFIRTLFLCLCALFLTTYTTNTMPGGFNFANAVIGLAAGLALGGLLIVLDLLFKGGNLRGFNIAILGLFFGYLMGEAILLIFNAIMNLSALTFEPQTATLIKAIVFLASAYLGMSFTARASEELSFSIPFIRFKSTNSKKKDILLDWSILIESRIIDLANSGLLDDLLIVPRLMLKELYIMLESSDETIRNKAKRCLDIFKKLETIPSLDLRYSEIDYPEIKDSTVKLIQLARALDANLITSDISRFQQYPIEGVRIINIHMLSNALKPLTGEQLSIKIQRYGKEPRQGVGYLEDGTMVVVNGGAEFIGDTIKAHVLSVKHTSSGRMIFCNVAEDSLLMDNTMNHLSTSPELDAAHKNYFTL
jgi:uncharacterized protein YacL